MRGAESVEASDILDKLATVPTPKFFGLFRGVLYEYEVFDPATLQRDLARIEHLYRARGYFDAHARAGRVFRTSDNHVKVEFIVEEGPPTLTHTIRVEGVDALPDRIRTTVVNTARDELGSGVPFDDEKFRNTESEIRRALTQRGYAYATVKREVFVDIVAHEANASFTVIPGETATFGKLVIVGLDPDGPGPREPEIEEAPLRRVANLREGARYSSKAIEEAQGAVLDLGVLASADIAPDLSHPESRTVNLTMTVEPTRLRQLRLGGGFEFDQIKTELHAITGWEHRNFLGDLRDFSVDFTPGVVLHPTRLDNIVAPQRALLQEKLRFTLRQQAFLEARTTGFVQPEFNIYPLLVQTSPSPDANVIGYAEFKGAIGVERKFLRRLSLKFSYNAQVENPFSYKGDLDPDLNTLVIAFPQLTAELDFRDNWRDPRKSPHQGILFRNDLQVAGHIFGGRASDIKVQPEVRTYIPLGKRVTFATRASVGLLIASNYGDVIRNHLSEATTPDNRAERVRDIETMFFRGFFSGGPTQNRGFPVRGIAPHGVVPFLNPATASQQVALSCEPTPANNYTPDPNTCAISIGGFSLWELSNELRVNITGPLSAATFCDQSAGTA